MNDATQVQSSNQHLASVYYKEDIFNCLLKFNLIRIITITDWTGFYIEK